MPSIEHHPIPANSCHVLIQKSSAKAETVKSPLQLRLKFCFLKLASCSTNRYSLSRKQSRRPKESSKSKGLQARQYLIIP
ncbi:hypothetical protein SLA2020_129370 [Shorea laevis]